MEHRVELRWEIADSALILDGGKAVYHGDVEGAIKHFQKFKEIQVLVDDSISESKREPAVEFEHVWYRFSDGNYVIKDVSFKVMPGELVFLVGPNGSGKSTLLRLLNGVYRPSKGAVRVCGIDTRKASIAELSKRVGAVLQKPDHQLFTERIIDKIEIGTKNWG
ncbi:MAG: ATP-binding cassette domain-containing protein [Nitrososphaeria archaeon]